jgi:RNA polymerase sigma-70 factor (ECF subfamily)
LIRIAVHEALARSRRSRRMAPLDDADEVFAMPSPTSSPEEHTSDREVGLLLERAVDQLPEEFRLVFVLRAVEQMSVADVAECLGLPEQTVKTRFFRARQRLRHLLLNHLEENAGSVFEFHLTRCDRVVNGVLSRIRRR